MKTRNIREVKKKTRTKKAKWENSTDGIVWNLVGRVNKLEEKAMQDMLSVYGAGFDTTLKEVGVDDSEEVEFTKQELSTIYYAMKEVGENFPSGNENEKYLNTIIFKLNKMLKEKE